MFRKEYQFDENSKLVISIEGMNNTKEDEIIALHFVIGNLFKRLEELPNEDRKKKRSKERWLIK